MHSIVRDVVISNCIIMGSNRGIVLMSSVGTGLVENILLSNMRFDTRVRAGNWWGNGEAICLMGTYHNIEAYRDPEPSERKYPVAIRNVRFQNVVCTSENAIGIVGSQASIENVDFDGLTVQLKDSENLPLKGRRIDIAPGIQDAVLPDDGKDYWLYQRGAVGVTFRNLRILPFHGGIPEIYVENDEPAFL